ncbi:hypothetical protein H0H87_004261 [Tephrocybe sp. NHM501043]|nr:hypothetical protein H0H87_004261 [Tephrocybe sp. NHM501043]
MLHTASAVLSTLLLVSLASASPSLVSRSCSPSYSADQTIYVRPPITDIGVYEWTPESYSPGAHITLDTRPVNDAFRQAEFSILKQDNGLYTIIPAFRTQVHIALTAGDDGDISFGLAGLRSIPYVLLEAPLFDSQL